MFGRFHLAAALQHPRVSCSPGQGVVGAWQWQRLRNIFYLHAIASTPSGEDDLLGQRRLHVSVLVHNRTIAADHRLAQLDCPQSRVGQEDQCISCQGKISKWQLSASIFIGYEILTVEDTNRLSRWIPHHCSFVLTWKSSADMQYSPVGYSPVQTLPASSM
jgi:hypothetical protein